MAAVALMWCAARRDGRDLDGDQVRAALSKYQGIKRRLAIPATLNSLYMDDYAHHPREISARYLRCVRWWVSVGSRRFSTALYTRTRDLCDGFVESLSMADRVLLLPIPHVKRR